MSVPQQKFREIVFQLLYGLNHSQSSSEQMIPLLMEQLAVSKKNVREALVKALAVYDKSPDLDILIASVSKTYEFDRIQSVERTILQLAVFEMFHDDAIPPKVAISEAIRLARKFSTPQSATFVNAILDALYKKNAGQAVNEEAMKQSFEILDSYYEAANELMQQQLKEEKPHDESNRKLSDSQSTDDFSK